MYSWHLQCSHHQTIKRTDKTSIFPWKEEKIKHHQQLHLFFSSISQILSLKSYLWPCKLLLRRPAAMTVSAHSFHMQQWETGKATTQSPTNCGHTKQDSSSCHWRKTEESGTKVAHLKKKLLAERRNRKGKMWHRCHGAVAAQNSYKHQTS